MCVSKEVSAFVVHHDAFIKGVEFDEAILPAFGLSSEIVGVEAAVFMDWCGILGGRDSRRAACCGSGHILFISWWKRERSGEAEGEVLCGVWGLKDCDAIESKARNPVTCLNYVEYIFPTCEISSEVPVTV